MTVDQLGDAQRKFLIAPAPPGGVGQYHGRLTAPDPEARFFTLKRRGDGIGSICHIAVERFLVASDRYVR